MKNISETNLDRILSDEEQAAIWNQAFGEYMPKQSLLTFSRELASIAQTGLTYSKEPFDRERFARLRVMAGELLQLPDYSPDFKWPDEFTRLCTFFRCYSSDLF